MTQLSTLIQGSGKNAIDKRSYIATSGQTVFAVIYSPPYVDVYQNGVRLNVVDYTATSGTSVTLGVGAAVNDEIEVIGFISDASIVVNYNTGITPPAVPIEGMMWYDTTDGSLYIRTGGFWVEASQAGATQGIQGIQGPPGDGVIISGITVTDASYNNTDDTAVGLTGGYIKVTGTGFVSGCTIVVGTVIATSVTYISSTEVRAQLPALAAGTYVLYVSNPSGAVAIRVNAITFSALPTWVSTSPLPNGKLNEAISIQLSGTSDSSVTYALQSGSTVPSGLTLSSAGLLSGTVTGIVADTTYNFTVVATDAELQDSPKAFSITITATYAVARSLRLRSAASASLSRTPAASGSLTTWTMSMWVKRGSVSSAQDIFGALTGSGATTEIYIAAGGTLGFYWNSSNSIVTSAVLRDPAAWYHLVFVWDTNNATAANRVSIYINSVLQDITLTGSYPTSGLSSYWNQALSNTIGTFNASNYFDGELAEINFVDGQALTAASFGQVSVTSGTWVPKAYAGTYGTNGFFLKFADNSANTAAAIGKDSSTNGNNWTPNNISLTAGSTYDSLLDSPTPTSTTVGNYAVLNPLQIGGTTMTPTPIALSNGNLSLSYNRTSTGAGWVQGTIAIPATGKWYYEYLVNSGSPVPYAEPGIMDIATPKGQAVPSIYKAYYSYDGTKGSNGVYTAYGVASTFNDIIGVAVDMDNGALYYSKNGTWLNSGVPTSGASKTGAAFTDLISAGVTWVPMIGVMGNNYSTGYVNFGQQPWQASIPTGFLALNTFNLPISAVPNPATAMAATTYTGNGSTLAISNAVNSVSFKPDLIWFKGRNQITNSLVQDSVRGAGYGLNTTLTNAEASGVGTGLTAFGASGFSLSGDFSGAGSCNINTYTYVAWQWKAGGAVSANNNTAGTITSTVSANQAAGFSVVTFTGNGVDTLSGVATVGHGLGVTPSFIITKKRSSGTDYQWSTYHISNGNANVWLNSTSAKNSGNWVTAPAATVFTPPVSLYGNESGVNYVAYCWAPVAGYSKFGTYTGNGSADGPFIYTGFRPRWLMIKCSSAAGGWKIYNTSGLTYNTINTALEAQDSAAEVNSSSFNSDWLSNGFKLRTTYADFNTSGATYIYAAFAESAFNFATAR